MGRVWGRYGDLNDFKPYNDHLGYWRGDEMVRLAACTLVSHCDPRRDFVGHVAGDDFAVLFQSDDWLDRCARIVSAFHHGVRRLFGFTTLSIGRCRCARGHSLGLNRWPRLRRLPSTRRRCRISAWLLRADDLRGARRHRAEAAAH